MRVLLAARPGTGGAARVLEALLRRLPERGVTGTAVLSGLEGTDLLDAARRHGWETVRLDLERGPCLADLAARRELARLIPGHDLVHAHAAKAGALVRLAADGVPVVYAPHGFYFTYHGEGTWRHRLWRAVERRLAPRTAYFHCVSEAERDLCVASGFCAADRAVAIPNPVPPRRTGATTPLPAFGTGPLVLMVARFAAPKDPVGFFQAAARVDPSLGARFVLVGRGPLEEEARRAAELVPEGRAWVLTADVDVRALLARSRVAVLATASEALPLFLLEALEEGVPAVASDLPGTREAAGDAALFAPSCDAPALAAAIERLLREPALREDLARRARARAPRFAEDAWLDAVVALYERATATPRA